MATGGAALAGGLTFGLHADPQGHPLPKSSLLSQPTPKKSKPQQSSIEFEEKRSHPVEGLEREDITITDIQVTPLSYVHDGEYLWRVGGLIVWKSDAALVQVFTNKGIVGIAEGSPYRGPDILKKYTDTYITPLLKGANKLNSLL